MFLSTLEAMLDTMAVTAQQRSCEAEMDEGILKNPEELLENKVFWALCFQFEPESPKLSDTGLLKALEALVKLCMESLSTLMVSLVSESQECLDKGQVVLEICVFLEKAYGN